MSKKTVSYTSIYRCCCEHFGEDKIKPESDNTAKILIVPKPIDDISYFLIRGNETTRILKVEFHIKNNRRVKNMDILETAIESWKGIPIISKNSEDSDNTNKYYFKTLLIECYYYEGLEKLLEYINEFTCRVNCRIKDLFKIPL